MIPYCILAIEDPSDREFMTELFLHYQKLMYATIQKITQDHWLIDDIFQSTLERLIDKITLLRTFDRDRLINYIIVSCRNNAYTIFQNQNRHFMEDIEDFIGEASISQSISDVEDYVIMQSQLEALQSIWPRLDMRSRYILEAKYILEKSDKEIADELHIKPQSVRMALTRARKNAIELLRKWCLLNNIEVIDNVQ